VRDDERDDVERATARAPDSEHVRFEVRTASRELAEHVVGEVWEAGATGVEERELGTNRAPSRNASSRNEVGLLLIVYAASADADRVVAASRAVGSGVVVGRPEIIEELVWSEEWKKGLKTITVSDRLRVRPSFVEGEPLAPGQREILIDPGQAFGTGGHASTLLVLEWLDELARRAGGHFGESARVLDVGTGTGVLALSALALGAGSAVGHDLDALATREAREWAERNRLAGRMAVFTGPIEALEGAGFDLVVANLLKRELIPISGPVARAVGPAGHLVLSGLLRADLPPVEEALAPHGLRVVETREQQVGGDHWISPLLARTVSSDEP